MKQLINAPEASLPDISIPEDLPDSQISIVRRITTYEVLHFAFIYAAHAAVTSHLTTQKVGIPLGVRTITHTSSGLVGGNDDYSFDSTYLSTINLNLVSKGKLVVSLANAPEQRLVQLCVDNLAYTIRNGGDMWLAPGGYPCRLISSSSSLAKSQNKQLAWKKAVSSWLQKFGLDVTEISSIIWVEVGVTRPNSKVNGRPFPHSDRFLWPAKFCFIRKPTWGETDSTVIDMFFSKRETSLCFARRWLEEAATLSELGGNEVQSVQDRKSEQPQTQSAKAKKLDIPESLARVIPYPDSQIASAMYPTPPEGAVSQDTAQKNVDAPATSSRDVIDHSNADGEGQDKEIKRSSNDNEATDAVLGPTSAYNMGIGSGMYDATGDEDLFRDMDDAYLCSKGITEADFNFFDTPDFAGEDNELGRGSSAQNVSEDNGTGVSPNNENNLNPTILPNIEPSKDDMLAFSNPSNFSSEVQRHTIPASAPMDNREIVATTHASSQPPPIVRRQLASPPLKPVNVRDILFLGKSPAYSSHTEGHDLQSSQKPSRYDSINLQQNIEPSNEKYRVDGRFWFSLRNDPLSRPSKQILDSSNIPTVGFPKFAGDSAGRKRDSVSNNALLEHGESHNALKLEGYSTPASSNDLSNDESETDSILEENPGLMSIAGTKRKRDQYDGSDASISTAEERVSTPFWDQDMLSRNDITLLECITSDSHDWPTFGKYLSWSEQTVSPVLIAKEEAAQLAQVAQLVVDQVTQTSLLHGSDKWGHNGNEDMVPSSLFGDDEPWGQGTKLDMKSYATLEDLSDSSNPSTRSVGGSVCKLSASHVRVRRGNGLLDIIPSAIPFWETFRLEPFCGEKDILSFCIYPNNIAEDADNFVERLGQTYTSCNLGKHDWPSGLNGLIPWGRDLPSDSYSYASLMQMLKTTCVDLGKPLESFAVYYPGLTHIGSALCNISEVGKSVVVYIINPFLHDASLVDVSSAFLASFYKYVEEAKRRHLKNINELVLQIVPVNFVSSTESIVVPAQLDYLRLALEVYSRCPPRDGMNYNLGSAPPIIITEPIPKSVVFRVNPEPTPPLEEGRLLHIAYSQSFDRRWITAAWTDNVGRDQTSLSYCRSYKESRVWRETLDIIKDIWDATVDIMEMNPFRWRVMLAKDEPIAAQELDGMLLRVSTTRLSLM